MFFQAWWSLIPSHPRDYVRHDNPDGQPHRKERRPFNLGYQFGDQDDAQESGDKDNHDPHKYPLLLIPGAHALSLTAGSTPRRAGVTTDIIVWLVDLWRKLHSPAVQPQAQAQEA